MMRSPIIGVLALASFTSVALADGQKPSVPTNVVATPLDDSSIRVTWNPAWDNVGVDGYNVYRNRSYYATVHGVTNFVDTRVSAGQSYDYSVVAFDPARNYTSLSEADTATPGGSSDGTGAAPVPRVAGNGTAPSVPDGLNAAALGNGSIELSWNAATGNVSGYNVYRDGSYRTTVRSTSWTDSGLAGGRDYRYSVVSFSSDAKFSSHSGEVVGRTDGSTAEAQAAPQVRAASATTTDSAQSSGSVPAGYNLVFSEEFNGSRLDSSKWNGSFRWGPNWTINSERQYYVDAVTNPDFGYNPFVFEGDKMSITAARTPDHLKGSANNKSYVSGTLTTHDKFTLRYGYVEMRAKLPKGQGLWPALWLLHAHENGSRPEIDIMEFLGRDVDTVYNVYHRYEGWNLRSSPTMEASGPDYTAGFHTFGMLWEPGRIIWYVDGREANRYEGGDVSSEDMYLIINLALGGYWGGDPDGSTPFPARYTIDYVRAYQR